MILEKDKYLMEVFFIGKNKEIKRIITLNKSYRSTLDETIKKLRGESVEEIFSISFIKAVKNNNFEDTKELYMNSNDNARYPEYGCSWRRIPKYFLANLEIDFGFLKMSNGKKEVIINWIPTLFMTK